MSDPSTASYYGKPVVKPHVWTPFIPWYFWIGGTTGAAAVHCAIERARGNDALADVQKRVALAGVLVSPVLLILDLGVPMRFINMLRVFKPTSPMSMGSWILSSLGAAVAGSTLADLLGAKRVGRALEIPAALLGPCLTTYTAALIADTATPIWHEAYAQLPFVFAASGIAGAGACGVAFASRADAGSARRMMIGGALAMAVTTRRMESTLGPLLSEPYREGKAGSFKRVSGALALAGAALGMLGARKSRTAGTIAATLVAASGVFERFAILAAGKQSAQDPKYTVEPQRARMAQREAAAC